MKLSERKGIELFACLFTGDIVVFADRGNISRSSVAYEICSQVIAERDLNHKYWCVSGRTQALDPEDMKPVDHANLTYYPQYELVQEWLEKNNIDLSDHLSDKLLPWFAEKSAIIFAMDQRTLEAIGRIYPECTGKAHLFSTIRGESHDITDTESMTNTDDILNIYEDIRDTLTNHFDNIPKLIEGQRRRRLESLNACYRKERL